MTDYHSGLQQADEKAIREATEAMQHEIAVNRRNRIAEMITASMMSGRERISVQGEYTIDACARIVRSAVTLADALIAELDK
jgi:hypothetical protein